MTLDHPFFQKTRKEQARFQRKLALTSLLILVATGALLFLVGLLPLLAVAVAILLSILAPFFDVPGLVRAGKLQYYSPFLLAEAERKGTVVLHAGTLFDFYFLFPKTMPASQRKRLVLTGMIDGLVDLIEDYEERGARGVTIRTTSYILNGRNAARLGLEKQPTDGLQTLLLYFNYFNLSASYSLLNRRLRFPSVRSVETFEGNLAKLSENKSLLESLRSSLRR